MFAQINPLHCRYLYHEEKQKTRSNQTIRTMQSKITNVQSHLWRCVAEWVEEGMNADAVKGRKYNKTKC